MQLLRKIVSFQIIGLILLFVVSAFLMASAPAWGFFGHRLINKMAVFTLPQEMLPVFKRHIHFISEHAVDPDKRRYALKNEAYRHYIDIDHWDTIPFPTVPRDLKTAILSHGSLIGITTEKDSVDLTASVIDLGGLYRNMLSLDRYSPLMELERDSMPAYLQDTTEYQSYVYQNPFVTFGVLPYFLEDYYNILVKVFTKGDMEGILKISADMGHYIADAHVPLHTTVNYNGQLTNQIGIHAFWESRLPELFAYDEYDMVVGKAEYIQDKRTFFWDIITESHRLLAEVLSDEIHIKTTFPEDRQFCFDTRLERTVRLECPEYAAAYHNALDGMVEQRMQDAILALGSVWYSAWIDAGQPDLSLLEDNRDSEQLRKEKEELEAAAANNTIKGRAHDR